MEAAGETGASRDTVMGENQNTADSQEAAVDTDMKDLTEAMSSLKFVPRTVRFGPKQRAGFARR